MQPQLLQRPVEVMPGGQGEAVDGARPLLPQVHFVQVTLENLLLAEMQLQQHRHHHFGQLAHNRALRGEIVVLDQLLGNRAATGHHLPGAQVAQRGAGNTRQGKAPVLVETLILHRQQRGAQALGHVVQPYQYAVLAVVRINAADLHRVQAHQVHSAVAVTQHRNTVALHFQAYQPRRLALPGETETAGVQVEAIARARHITRPPRCALLAIPQYLQLPCKVVGRQGSPREQLQRAGIHLGGELPHFVGKRGCDTHIKIDHHQQAEGAGSKKQLEEWTTGSGHGRSVTHARFHLTGGSG